MHKKPYFLVFYRSPSPNLKPNHNPKVIGGKTFRYPCVFLRGMCRILLRSALTFGEYLGSCLEVVLCAWAKPKPSYWVGGVLL